MTGFYICNVCEQDGREPGERFKVPADGIGVALMEEHLRTAHPETRPCGERAS